MFKVATDAQKYDDAFNFLKHILKINGGTFLQQQEDYVVEVFKN